MKILRRSGQLTASIRLLCLLIFCWFGWSPTRSNAQTVPENDSLALVDLYNSTNGPNWIKQTNWLTGKVDTWYGVSVRYGRVSTISLENNGLKGQLPASLGKINRLQFLYLKNNQLTGDVPVEMAALSFLRTLQVQNNQLTGLPDLSGLTSLTNLVVYYNQLTFKDIEPNVGKMDYTHYNPQAPVDTSYTVKVGLGGTVRLSVRGAGGKHTLYRWFVDWRPLGDASPDSNYVKSGVISEDGGVYNCQIFNSMVPNLELLRSPVTVEIPIINSVSDSLALVELYNATNGANWYNHDNWLTGKLDTWYGVSLYRGRVSELNLLGNNLSGIIPASITNLNRLETLQLQSNHLTGLPDLSGMSRLMDLFISSNQLGFKDLEPNVRLLHNPESYRSQYPATAIPVNLDIPLNGQFSLTASPDGGARTQYNWFRDDVKISSERVYTVENTQSFNGGVYTCVLTNPLLLGLEITRDTVTVNIPVVNSQSDSLALIDLYNATGGANWTNHTNWLSGNLATWYGVNLRRGSVKTLSLGWNNLTGDIPASITKLINLQELLLPYNQLTGLPDMSDMKVLKSVKAMDNQLTFEDLEPNVGKFFYSDDYAGQRTGIEQRLLVSLGDSITMTAKNVGGTRNRYQWYLRSRSVTKSLEIPDFTISSVQEADAGSYFCYITNDLVPFLTIRNASITVELTVSKTDSLALVDLYNSTNGPGWQNQFNANGGKRPNWLTGPVKTWYGVSLNGSGRVTSLTLYYSNLSGDVPTSINNLTELRILQLKNNQLTGLPNLSRLTKLFSLDVSENRLTFKDIEQNRSIFSSFGFCAPQALVGSPSTIDVPIDGSFTLSASTEVGGSQVRYQWFRDGQAMTELSESNVFKVGKAASTDGGVYYCQISDLGVSRFTLEQAPITVNIPLVNSASDSLALVDLYSATDGANWTNHTNWLTGKLETWYGVTLVKGRVTQLYLYSNNLNGTLPESIGNLSKLNKLSLFYNSLSGNIPASTGNLTDLQDLALAGNKLTGDIPESIGKLANLNALYLYGNLLTGNIPTSLSSLTNLNQLYLNNNQLSGNISDMFYGMPNLQWLNLGYNQFTGTFPSGILKLRNLVGLFISYTQLSGDLPTEIGQWTNLQYLDLGHNQFTGTIPQQYADIKSLNLLSMAENQLTGSFPVSLTSLPDLQTLYLSSNQLSGVLPPAIGDFPKLRSLVISFNQFTGAVPDEINQLDSLQYLDLSNNQFSDLPVLTGLTKLNGFYAYSNRLTFEDLEPNMALMPYSYQYSPQAAVNDAYTLDVPIGGSFTLSTSIGGSRNQYQWFRDDQPITELSSQSDYAVTNAQSEAGGIYRCQIINPLVPNLWINRNHITVNLPFLVSASDSLALVDLYNSTDGSNWTHHDNWLTGKLETWYGVNLMKGRVQGLDLHENNLVGVLPTSIGNLSRLKILFLQLNKLSGSIPDQVGNLGLLETVWLNDNQLSDNLPVSIGKLGSLQTLMIWGNQLTGTIPESIGNLHRLLALSLARNQFTGEIPEQFSQLTQLNYLDLSGNQLAGTIPKEIGGFSYLHQLFLQNNLFTGAIPSEIGKLSYLSDLWIFSNQLSGIIPGELGNLTNLQSLWLFNNQLSGNIPVSLGNLPNLQEVWLFRNKLSGSIPAELSKASKLRMLLLSENQLTGNIPDGLGNLTQLLVLDLNNNLLTGGVPSTFDKLASLQYLNLANNRLTGVLPDFKNLTGLISANLNNNQLSGELPFSFTRQPSLSSLNLYDNRFTSLPDFSGSANLQFLGVSKNHLTFEDLEPNMVKFNGRKVLYVPQDSVGLAGKQNLASGQALHLSVAVGGANNRYQWTKDSTDVAGATDSTFDVSQVSAKDAGWYSCRITNTLVDSLVLYRRRVYVSVSGTPVTCTATGTILREFWANVPPGYDVSSVPVFDPPTSTSQLTLFEGPSNVAEHYGSRIRGYLCAPQTGNYTFWIASDDHSELWLSTDDSPANKVKIASVNGFVKPRQWDAYPSQHSAWIRLEKGRRYYIEAIHKEDHGCDHLAVGWRLPDYTIERPIPGIRLSPFVPDSLQTCPGNGGILREYWDKVPGNEVTKIPLNKPPKSTSLVTSFEGPTNVAEFYGARYRGYLCPPVNGTYTFALAADDHAELWLSTDDSASNKVLIAFVDGYTKPRQWDKFASQRSVPMELLTGHRYYIEALHKEGHDEDNLAVGWIPPSSKITYVISGKYLAPFVSATARIATEEESAEILDCLAVDPNPFSENTTVRVTTAQAGKVVVQLYDLQGVLVLPLYEGDLEAGQSRQLNLPAGTLSEGVYFLRLTTGQGVLHKKIVLSR